MTATLTRRQLVGAGAADAALLATGAVPARAARRRTRRVDVCVIGAGLSGLAAWIGYMDGAVRAGQRAASEVIAAAR
jgi:monoamine oxidase